MVESVFHWILTRISETVLFGVDNVLYIMQLGSSRGRRPWRLWPRGAYGIV